MQARELMSTQVVIVTPETPVAAIAELLAGRGISAVPVVNAAGAPVGIVTEGDLIRRLADRPPGPLDWFLDLFGDQKPLLQRFTKAHGAVARDVMSSALITVEEDASAERIAELMQTWHVRRVLVLKDGQLAGVVSRADLLRAILNAPQSAAESDDRTILRAVSAAMRAQPWTDTFWISTDVAAGVVSLYGYVRSDEMRHALVALAREIPGVKSVQDRMDPMPFILRATL